MDRDTVEEHKLFRTIDDAHELFHSCLNILLQEANDDPNADDKHQLADVRDVLSDQIRHIQGELTLARNVKSKADDARPKQPEMVMIPAGKFHMGDNCGDGFQEEKPVRIVSIQKPFAMGRYEVTFEEYDRFAKATGRRLPRDQGWGRGHRPVIFVNWEDAQDYAKWLSEQTGKRYRLPTEAQWEYAARAGTETSRYWSDDPNCACDFANVYDETGATIGPSQYYIPWDPHECDDRYTETAPRGKFKSNKFGLHDMLGNVWEWVEDCWHPNYIDAPANELAWGSTQGGDCTKRVVRGGSWSSDPGNVRSSNRYGVNPGHRVDVIGFRLVQDFE